MTISVLIPTHAPRPDLLARTLAALQAQDLPTAEWELLLIDNASPSPLATALVAWHPQGRIVREEKLGLTPARLRGLSEAWGELLVWADDDNLLAPGYLRAARAAFVGDPQLGAAGGKAHPDYETAPPPWFAAGLAPLGCRDLGDEIVLAAWDATSPRHYPACAPIGAGLVIRRRALQTWANGLATDPRRQRLGRTGTALTSGEDNDINLTLLAADWKLAYLPALQLRHVIPARRLELDYLKRIARAASRDFVRVLLLHDASPWPAIPRWTLELRQAKAWFTHRAWRGPAAQIRWQGACGHFEGRVAWKSR